MGWIWRNEGGDDNEKNGVDFNFSQSEGGGDVDIGGGGGNQCFTRRVVRSQCKTEEVEPGKLIRKCEKTEELLRDCIGKPVEVLQSTKEYTEEDVSNQVTKESPFSYGKSQDVPFDFPGLRGDIEAIERELFGGINRFFGAADEMKSNFFDLFSSPSVYDREPSSQPSMRRGIPVEDHPQTQTPPKPVDRSGGDIDLSGLAKDV